MDTINVARLAALAAFVLGAAPAAQAGEGACSDTSRLMRSACSAETRDDFLVAKAKCLNENEFGGSLLCLAEAREALDEERENCDAQLVARLEVCADIGEAPYDPSFEPHEFDTDLDSLTTPNPYYPMGVGHTWTYGGGEVIEIEVLDETKLIDDVTCFVVRDVVFVDGLLVEDTDDWFALAKSDGAIWYCGEEVKDYEFFEGDSPSLPELVSIDGSFKVERDGDRSGVFFPGTLNVGHVFRQEFSLGNAEDIGEVVAIDYSYGKYPDLDELVPQDLAEYLCNDDCVVIAESTPIEPGVFERKYYAHGIGFFLGTSPPDDESVQLTDCNFDSRCDFLPEPEDR